jgi:phage terminase small subunit
MLTQRQEDFCLAYIESANASEAYRKVYSTKRMKPETVNNSAFKMLQKGDIVARIASIRESAAEKASMTLESHLSDLKNLRDAAVNDGKWAAAVTAEVSRGKAAGLYVEKVELSGDKNNPLQVQLIKRTIIDPKNGA